MRILITGGAGYIGSHCALDLREAGHQVTIFDNLSTGHRWAVGDAPLIVGDLADDSALETLFAQGPFDAVVHFAARTVVPESLTDPFGYYTGNTANTIRLFRAAAAQGIKHVVFSSTAAVYGESEESPVDEDSPTLPINPYGASKLMSERILADGARAHGFTYAILRYFNVAGADPQARLGQATPKATHLIKVCCEAAVGLRDQVTVYGTDYPTPDGTCVRDYIHVRDLARAHAAALDHLAGGSVSLTLNCGYGHGLSVKEVVEAVKRISGVDFPVVEGERRPGDPVQLVAGNARIKAALPAWRPEFDDLDTIVRHALAWERKLAAAGGVARFAG